MLRILPCTAARGVFCVGCGRSAPSVKTRDPLCVTHTSLAGQRRACEVWVGPHPSSGGIFRHGFEGGCWATRLAWGRDSAGRWAELRGGDWGEATAEMAHPLAAIPKHGQPAIEHWEQRQGDQDQGHGNRCRHAGRRGSKQEGGGRGLGRACGICEISTPRRRRTRLVGAER